jgi:NAD+ kinase
MRVGFIVNRSKPLARKLVPPLVAWLKREGHEPLVAASTARDFGLRCRSLTAARLVRQVDLVVALGGDGTLLRAARLVGAIEKPIMGVNLGGLGFLTEFAADEARAGITAFVKGRHTEERRLVLECRYGRRHGFALNDIAVNMGGANRVIDISARIDRTLITRFVGDGVVVSTPTGSTAYSLAAGGPVVFPTMDAMLLTPLAPHALGSRPLILPADAAVTLELSPRSARAVLTLDGQERWFLAPRSPARVSRARFAVRLVTPRDKTYFEILRDKLKWAGSQRQ